MYNYIAVTRNTILNCTDLLRVAESGVIEQYDEKSQKWRDADNGMSGIYSGEIECETITEKQAKEIMQRWAKNAN